MQRNSSRSAIYLRLQWNLEENLQSKLYWEHLQDQNNGVNANTTINLNLDKIKKRSELILCFINFHLLMHHHQRHCQKGLHSHIFRSKCYYVIISSFHSPTYPFPSKPQMGPSILKKQAALVTDLSQGSFLSCCSFFTKCRKSILYKTSNFIERSLKSICRW